MSFEISRRAFVIAPLGIVACGSIVPRDEEKLLLERARAYWAYILNNDLAEAWRYEEISRDPRWTLQSYLKRVQLVYDEATVRGVKLTEGDQATVEVALKYSLPMVRMRGQEALLQDAWKKIDGQWYHAEAKSVFFKQTERKQPQEDSPK